jgi:hypothetical protein
LCVLASLPRAGSHAPLPIIASIFHDIQQKALPAIGYGGASGSHNRSGHHHAPLQLPAQAYMGQPLFKHFFSGKRFFCGVGQARKP